MIHIKFKETTDVHYGNIQINSLRRAGKLLWELIKGYIYTFNGRPIRTSNGRYIRCKNQIT